MTKDKLSTEERDIIDKFERGELQSAPGGEQEMEAARQVARNTLNSGRLTEKR